MTPDETDDFIRSEEWRDRLQTDFDMEAESSRQQWIVGVFYLVAFGLLAAIAWVGGV